MIKNIICCAVVDIASSGKYLIPALKRIGIKIVHVRSYCVQPPIEVLNNVDYSDVDELIIHRDLNETVSFLQNHDVSAVIAGNELGVELADCLAAKLSLPGNSLSKGNIRTNKYLMQDALREAGLKSILQCMSSDIDEAIAWINHQGIWPVVVKPIKSTASDGIYFCLNEEDVQRAFNAELNKINLLGSRNDKLLIQEKLVGDEFIVNAVSCNGKHYVTDIWKSTKRRLDGRALIYDNQKLQCSSSSEAKQITQYIFKVLDALGIIQGPSHSEVMLTSDGPVLIETGARLSGGIEPVSAHLAVGYNQLEATVDAYFNTESFMDKTDGIYSKKLNAMRVFGIVDGTGIVKNISVKSEAEKLNSIVTLSVSPKENDLVTRTVDLFTSPYRFNLVHEDEAQLIADYAELQRIMKECITLADVD